MSVEVSRTRTVWDHCVQVKTKVVARDSGEATATLRLIEEYDAALIAGDEYAGIVDRAQRND